MIPVLFNILFFLIPLIFLKNTSELFEFNKIITLYAFTTIIASIWIINSIRAKKLIFQKTILDWPLLIYLSVLFISTIFSLDSRTSWLGYYSRFNGGLVSQICYAVLYWAYVSNITAKQAKQSIIFIFISTALASILAIFEHFGVFTTCSLMGFGWKESCWVQDVQNRVFSTLGQPNWLAAILVAIIPLTWRKSYKYYFLSLLFVVTLLFTKSRSGLLAFGIETVIFWGYIFWKEKYKYLKEFIFFSIISVVLYISISSPFANQKNNVVTPSGPALESGGTESGTIRKYVWLGALEVFKHYPIIGTGPETFAFSYPIYKPVGHNLTSEWDFIYNKAHNDFLNYLANTGLSGFLSYLSIIFYSLLIFWKTKRFDLIAGYIAISVTNFFGFSVVPVSLLFFIFPAIALAESNNKKVVINDSKIDIYQISEIILVSCASFYILYLIFGYWSADISYNNAKNYNRSNSQELAMKEIEKSINFSKNEALYISELALSNNDVDTATKAFKLSPYNPNIRKVLISNLVKNAGETPNNLLVAEKIILDSINISPNDPRQYYQLGILQLKINKNDDAVKNLIKSVELKPNYKEGRFALGLTYKALKENAKAKEQLEYILKNIDPNDDLTKKYLEELNQPQK